MLRLGCESQLFAERLARNEGALKRRIGFGSVRPCANLISPRAGAKRTVGNLIEPLTNDSIKSAKVKCFLFNQRCCCRARFIQRCCRARFNQSCCRACFNQR